MTKITLAALVAVYFGLAFGFSACGTGGGGDDTSTTSPSTATDSENCAAFINGDLVVCLSGDCSNTQPIEEGEVSSDTEESDEGASAKWHVRGKVSGTTININMCSDQHTEAIEDNDTTNTTIGAGGEE